MCGRELTQDQTDDERQKELDGADFDKEKRGKESRE